MKSIINLTLTVLFLSNFNNEIIGQSKYDIISLMEYYGNNYGKDVCDSEFVESKIHPALKKLESIVCKNKDVQLFDCFLEMLLETQGSADEEPCTILGSIYICQPELVEAKFKKEETEEHLLDLLEFGFGNAAFNRENEIENYKELKSSIAKLIKRKAR